MGMKDVQKKQDRYSVESKISLIKTLEKNILGIARNYLNQLQIGIGKDHQKFAILRKCILDGGNDVVRKLTAILEQKYNIQLVPYRYVFKAADNKEKEGNQK